MWLCTIGCEACRGLTWCHRILCSACRASLVRQPRLGVAQSLTAVEKVKLEMSVSCYWCSGLLLTVAARARTSAFHRTGCIKVHAGEHVCACMSATRPRCDAQALLTAEDAVISDQLNHASIIDGIRLCKAQRLRHAPLRRAKLVLCDMNKQHRMRARCLHRLLMCLERGWPLRHDAAQSPCCYCVVGVDSCVQSSAPGRAPVASG